MACDSMRIGRTNETSVYLYVDGKDIGILSAEALDYDYMNDYIDGTGEIEENWRYDVQHGHTEQSLEEYREGYNYDYDTYFAYNIACDMYYADDAVTTNYKEWSYDFPDLANDILDWIEENIDIRWDVTIDEFRAKVKEFADLVAEEQERSKKKFRVYAYYK